MKTVENHFPKEVLFPIVCLCPGPRGYVPASKLVRYHQATEDPPPSPSPHLTLPAGGAGMRRHSTPESQSMTTMSLPCFQVIEWWDA